MSQLSARIARRRMHRSMMLGETGDQDAPGVGSIGEPIVISSGGKPVVVVNDPTQSNPNSTWGTSCPPGYSGMPDGSCIYVGNPAQAQSSANTIAQQQAAAAAAAAALLAQQQADALASSIAAANAAAAAATNAKKTIPPTGNGATTVSTQQAAQDAAATSAAMQAQADAAAAIKAANDALAAAQYQLQSATTAAQKAEAQAALDAANRQAAQVLAASSDLGVDPGSVTGSNGAILDLTEDNSGVVVGGQSISPALLIGAAVIAFLVLRK